MNKNKKIILSLIFAAFATIIVFCDRNIDFNGEESILLAMNGNGIVPAIVMGAFTWLYYCFFQKKYDRKIIKASIVLTCIFSMCELIGFYMDTYSSFLNIKMNMDNIVFNFISLAGYVCLIFPIITLVISFFCKQHVFSNTSKKGKSKFLSDSIYSVIAVIIILCITWGVYFIIFFPGIVIWDSCWQIEQGLGNMQLTDDHPFLHTLIEGNIIKLGTWIFGNINAGIAFFTFLQMFIIAFIIANVIRYLAKKEVPYIARVIILMFYALHPVIAIYSVTLWKDVWMGVFILIYAIFLFEMCTNTESFFKSKKKVLLFILTILSILFAKGTGILIIILSLPGCFIFVKRRWKYLLSIFIISFFIFTSIRTIAIEKFNIPSGHVQEPMSVPIQQISRLVKYHKEDLTEEEYQSINEILPVEIIGEKYDPKCSNNTKGRFNEEKFLEDKLKYAKVWLKLGLKHPFTYIDSFLANSYGYWYPETIYWEVASNNWVEMLDIYESVNNWTVNDINYKNYHNSPERKEIKENVAKFINTEVREVPILNLFFSIAIFFWIDLICLAIAIVKKKYNLIPVFLIVNAVFVSCIASPVHAEFRYAYAALVTLPLIIVYTLYEINTNKNNDKNNKKY